MNFKHNANYFKRDDSIKYIGIGLIILGFVLFYFGWGFISYILMSISIPIGAVLFIIGSSGRASDADIDSYTSTLTEEMEVDLSADTNYKKRILKHIPPEMTEGFEYHDGLMMKKGKNGSVRSSEFTKAIIYVLSDELYIKKRTVSLISDQVENETIEILYSDVNEITIEEEKLSLAFMKKSFNVQVFRLCIKRTDGNVLFLPIQNSVNSDNFVIKINKLIEEYKNENRAL